MKKTLLTIFAGIITASVATAQCIPAIVYADSAFGLWPDSLEFAMDDAAMGGLDYESQIDLKTFVDTSFSGFNVKIDAFKVLSITGLPAGFSWTGGGPTWDGTDTWYNEGATPSGTADPSLLEPVQGCLQLTAAAADVSLAAPSAGSGPNTFPLEVTVDIRIGDSDQAFLIGAWASSLGQSVVVTEYVLHVVAGVGVAELLNLNAFEVAQSYPNPANEMATITFTTPNSAKVQLNVYNMLGGLVYAEGVNSQKGLNKIELETASMTAGLYVYTVSNGEKTITKRMTIK